MHTNPGALVSRQQIHQISQQAHGAICGGLKPVDGLLERADLLRLDATRKLDQKRRVEMGQFLTPAPVARSGVLGSASQGARGG